MKEYKSKLILFPIHEKRKLRKGEATEEERKLATQLKGPIMPITNEKATVEFRQIKDKEKRYSAFLAVKQARIFARTVGIRAKKAKEAADTENNAPNAAASEKKSKK